MKTLRNILCFALVLLLAAPASSHVSVGNSLPDGSAGCHDDYAQGYHCHETDQDEEDEQWLIAAGAGLLLGLVVRSIRKNKKANEALATGQEAPKVRLKDLLRHQPKIELAPVENSLGKIDGAEVRLTFRF